MMARLNAWTADATQVLNRFYNDPAAVAVALHFIRAIKANNILLSSAPEPEDLDEARRASAETLVGFMVGLPLNPFWQMRSGIIQPVVTSAANAWMDALKYFADDKTKPDDSEGRTEFFAKTVGLKAMNIEIAVCVLTALKGSAMVGSESIALRDAMLELDIKHKV
jgi:hypothetical protein